jgi:nicotinamidase-related amidase
MNGPSLSPPEIRQILSHSIDQYVATGLDWSAAVAATARDFNATEYKVAALVETQRPPTGLLLAAR